MFDCAEAGCQVGLLDFNQLRSAVVKCYLTNRDSKTARKFSRHVAIDVREPFS